MQFDRKHTTRAKKIRQYAFYRYKYTLATLQAWLYNTKYSANDQLSLHSKNAIALFYYLRLIDKPEIKLKHNKAYN